MRWPLRRPKHAIVCKRLRLDGPPVHPARISSCYWCQALLAPSPATRRRTRRWGVEVVCWTCALQRRPGLRVEFLPETMRELRESDPAAARRAEELTGMPAVETMLPDVV